MVQKSSWLEGRGGASRARPMSASEMEAEILRLTKEVEKERKSRKGPQFERGFMVDPKKGRIGKPFMRKARVDLSKSRRIASLMRRLEVEDKQRFEELSLKLAKSRGSVQARYKRSLKRQVELRDTEKPEISSTSVQSPETSIEKNEKSFDFYKLDRMISESEAALEAGEKLLRKMADNLGEKPDESS